MEHLRGTPPQHNPFIWLLWRFDFRLISCSVLFVGLSTWLFVFLLFAISVVFRPGRPLVYLLQHFCVVRFETGY